MDESFSQALQLFVFLILSGFFSGSETAFFALTKIQLKQLENNRTPSSLRIFKLLKKPNQLLIVILLGNTIVNIAASTTAAILAINIGDSLHLPCCIPAVNPVRSGHRSSGISAKAALHPALKYPEDAGKCPAVARPP